MTRPDLLLGTHTFAASGDAARRQSAAVASMRALTGVSVVNLQFADGPHHVDGIETLAVLRQDSRTVSGRRTGARKAVVREMLDVLAAEAVGRGAPYFCYSNGDIIWSQPAVRWIADGGKQAYALSRLDVDGASGRALDIQLAGIDAVAMQPQWFAAHRHRFRDYIVGEICWDNVYTAILMCHGEAIIENRLGLLRHERHVGTPAPSVLGAYTSLLAALDAEYFHLWCGYWDRLRAMRRDGATPEAESQMARQVFTWRPPWYAPALRGLRYVRARARYAAARVAIQ
jgi:hypothetical protein